MNIHLQANTPADEQLIEWMTLYGDAIVKTCYLLCGDLPLARKTARQVFIAAHQQMEEHRIKQERGHFIFLLRLVMRLCPCRLCVSRFSSRTQLVSRLLLLPPMNRRIAVLCLYHGFTAEDAASILNIHPDIIASRLQALQHSFSLYTE